MKLWPDNRKWIDEKCWWIIVFVTSCVAYINFIYFGLNKIYQAIKNYVELSNSELLAVLSSGHETNNTQRKWRKIRPNTPGSTTISFSLLQSPRHLLNTKNIK